MSERYSNLKIGCCGFCLPRKQYIENFSLVEVQQTFYQPPRVKTLERWRTEVPEDFEFTLKAWQLITHSTSSPTYRRLRRNLSDSEREQCGAFRPSAIVSEAWEVTASCAETLKARRILFQCPASFRPTEENLENLHYFFSSVSRSSFRFMWEPRGAWPPDLVRDLCDELDLIHVVDPFQRDTVTPSLPYYRLHGPRGRHHYDENELAELPSLFPEDLEVYLLFNNVGMREDALRFIDMLRNAWP